MKKIQITILVLSIALIALAGLQLTNAGDKQVYVAIAASDGGTLTYEGTLDSTDISGVVTTPGEVVNFAVDPSSDVSVTAIPKDGFVFASWTINGQVVSSVAYYSAQVGSGIGTPSTPLTANFSIQLQVPEYPIAGLAAVLACFGAFVVFKKRESIFSFSK